MATLKAKFKLFDGYSTTIDKINRKTKEATDKILNASRGTDNFNKKLESTGASANIANNGLKKLVGTVISLAGIKKSMDISDSFMNTSARLNLINDGLQTQAELQDKIFAAADRAKGSYSEMANAISKMGLLAGDAFTSNDELIAFTELVQKGFKVGGADTSEQQGAMRQLSQAMASGRLQGDELVSIMENAPMIYDAIAKYTGKSKGELKKLSSEGFITADVIKNAMFDAGEDINTMFRDMPMTFGDVWNKIKNGGVKAFDSVIVKVNELINTQGFEQFVNGVIIGFDLVAQAVGWLINVFINSWDTIGPILSIISSLYLVSIITKLWAMISPLIAQGIAWMEIYWPLLLVIGIIAIAISAARQFGASWEQIFGFVGGIVGTFAGHFYNGFVYIWNAVAAFINFLEMYLEDPVSSIQILFYDLMVNVLGYIETMAKGIEDVINKIPGVNVDITSGLTGFKNKIKDASATIKDESGFIEYVKTKEFIDYSAAFTKGSDIGKGLSNSIGDAIGNLTDKLTGKDKGFDLSDYGTSSNPLTIEGTGKNGSIEVDMADEDLQYLRDIAERDYINKFSTATLAPNIEITFGDVHEEADADKVAGRIKKILQEEIATAAEGVY